MARNILIKVFLTAVVIRVLYSLAVPAIYFNVDTEGYYNIGMTVFTHPSIRTLITPYRTPVYPMFLNGMMYILGAGGTPFGSPAFVWNAQFIAVIQMIVGAIAFTVFYKALSHLLPRRSYQSFAVFLFFDVLVIGWERTLLTQGLAISVSLFITAVLFHMLLRPTGKKFLLLFLLCTLGFLIRPQIFILPIVTLPLIVWYFRKNGRIVFWSCLTLAALAAIPLIYARINYQQYKYFGLQFGGDIAVLGRILEFNVPIDSAKNNTYFYTTVSDSRATNHITMPFRFLEQYDPAIYDKPYRLVQLQAFNQTVIFHTFPLFVMKAIGTIPEILLEVCEITLVPPHSTHVLTRIVGILQQIYGYAQYATLAVPVLWIPMGILFLVKPTRWNTMVFLTGTIAVSEVVFTALTMYHDTAEQYGRIISLVRPHLFLFLFLCTLTCIRMYRKHRI